jgi:two-component system CheB/CheR fusion protein
MHTKSDNTHYIVGIGASAGGLEAYSDFFDHAPENSRLSYILVQHLSPDYKSLLVDLLSRHTDMKICEAENGMKILPNCIYVIPPGKNLTVGDDQLVIEEKDSSDKGPNTSIDTFFYSLADKYGDRAIAIVLSGTGTDGSRGIEAIKDAEGLVIVQDPQLAKFDGMPRSSIATGRVDLILPTSSMHVEIINYINELPVVNLIENDIDKDVLNKVLSVLHKQTGCDFHQYKMQTILRRLTRRLAFLKIASVEEYLEYITANANEGKIFCKDLLIGVTKFFRDKDAFHALREKVLIPLIDSKHDFESIKIWISACSTGEEVYSVAMLLNDLIRKRNRNLEVKIFGTDLDAAHIEKASKGEYPEFIDKEIPVEFLNRYFIKRDNTYTIIPEIRKQIVFAKHNLITDPPFIKNDLISCRNMLIYVNTQLQKIILSKFSFGLNKNGYLFLGPSESIATNKDAFAELDRKWKLFTKTESELKGNYPGRYEDRLSFHSTIRKNKSVQSTAQESVSLVDAVNQSVLEDFAIVGFYLDRNYIIQETVGNYKKYLLLPEESLKFNLLKMLPDAVSTPLNTAIIQAWKNNQPVMLNNLHYELNGQKISLVISVRPDKEMNGNTLVMFNSTPYMFDLPESPANAEEEVDKTLLTKLKRELKESKFNLQTAIEELETTNEELQSSNEELLSSNEELQSSNEELQSLNEELHTLNTEHQLRIQELIDLNDDLNNYFRCSDIGQVIVDKDLLVRKFNPAAASLINLIESDISRSITHLTTNFRYEYFERDIKEVLLENKVLEKELNVGDGVTLLVRIYSYIRKNNVIDGALISFIDISGFKKLNSIINGVFDASKSSIMAFSAARKRTGEITELFSITSNAVANELFGRNLSEEHIPFSSINTHLYDLIYRDLVRVIETGESFVTELGINDKWFAVSAVKMMDGLALTLNDISDRKMIEDQLRKSYGDLFVAKENLKQLNQNLEKRVEERTRELAVSEERFRLVSTVTNDVVVDWNFMNNSIWLSDNYERLLGYEKEAFEPTRKFWLDKVHPEDRDRINKAVNGYINASETSWELEYRYQHADGSYKLINDRGYLMLDEHNTPYRMLSSMLDITEIRNAKNDLKESEMRLSMALDAATMAGWDINMTTGAIIYSDTLPKVFGHTTQHNFTADDFIQQLHPEDRTIHGDARARMVETGLYEYEARIVWPDNSIKWIKTIGKMLLGMDNKPLRMIGITRDITKDKEASLQLEQMVKERTVELRKKNEDLSQQNEFIETIFDASVNSIAVVNKDLVITSVNKACEDIFMIKRSSAIGQKYTDVFSQSEAVFDYSNIVSVFSGKSLHNSVLINRGDTTKYLDNYFIPLAYNNNVYGALIISHDITEIHDANQKLSQINNQLTKSNSDLEQFAYIASHDLQEPLRKIRVFISIINQKRAKDDVDAYLHKIAASAERMSSLIKNVLDFSRLSSGKDGMTDVDLNLTIQSLLIDFELIINEKQAVVKVGKLPHISGIPHQISQLFSNLLSNSLKFCVHTPEISIDAIQLTSAEVKLFEHLDLARKYVAISFKDNGIGFEQKYAEKVFGFFYRMAHTEVNYKGNGIGLALCKKIVENHGGLITVNSVIDKGTTFKIILPVV